MSNICNDLILRKYFLEMGMGISIQIHSFQSLGGSNRLEHFQNIVTDLHLCCVFPICIEWRQIKKNVMALNLNQITDEILPKTSSKMPSKQCVNTSLTHHQTRLHCELWLSIHHWNVKSLSGHRRNQIKQDRTLDDLSMTLKTAAPWKPPYLSEAWRWQHNLLNKAMQDYTEYGY